jgi:hypothetical protein
LGAIQWGVTRVWQNGWNGGIRLGVD